LNESDIRSVHVAGGMKTVGAHAAKRCTSRIMCAWSAYPATAGKSAREAGLAGLFCEIKESLKGQHGLKHFWTVTNGREPCRRHWTRPLAREW